MSGGFTTRQDLNWTAVPGAAKYVILQGTAGPGSETAYTTCCTAGPPFIANHLSPSTNYCWTVKSVGANGQSSGPSNEVCLTSLGTPVVPPPATVTAIAVSSTRVNVDWSAVASATKYFVNQSIAGGNFTRIATVSAPTVTFPNINLTPSTLYCYTIETVTNSGQSVPSSPPACATTFALGLEGYWRLTETTGTTAADVSGFARNATLSGGAAFSAAQPQAPIDPPIGSNEPHLNSGAAGVANTATSISAFRLTSAFSISLWARQPAAGTDIRLLGMRNAGICGSGQGWELSQSAAGLAFIGQAGSLNFGRSLVVGDWTHIAVTYPGGAGGTMRLYINGVEVANGAYTAANAVALPLSFGHAGGCAGGNVSLDEVQIYSRQLSAGEVATFGTLPPAPTALVFTKNLSTSQGLSWTPPAGLTSRWIIMRGVGPTGPGNETHYTHAPNPPTTFNASHLDPNTQYAWQVKAIQGNLISLPSNEIVQTTPDVPPAPTGVTATAVSQTRINVSWTAVPAATRYFVFMSPANAPGGPYTLKGSVAAPAVTFGAIGLTANSTYGFQVQAEDAGFSKSAMSATAQATTLP